MSHERQQSKGDNHSLDQGRQLRYSSGGCVGGAGRRWGGHGSRVVGVGAAVPPTARHPLGQGREVGVLPRLDYQ